MNNLIFIGFMGTGKTSISNLLSKKLNTKLIDIDILIEENKKMSISQIFEKLGEDSFRNFETETLKSLHDIKNTIISCGGGIILRKENVEHLKKIGTVILLKSKPETILNRLKNTVDRPLLNNNMNLEFIKNKMNERELLYENAKDFVIYNENKTIEFVVDEIINKIKKDNLI